MGSISIRTISVLNAYLLARCQGKMKVEGRAVKTYRESRKLTRTPLTQSVFHVSNASAYLRECYVNLTNRPSSDSFDKKALWDNEADAIER